MSATTLTELRGVCYREGAPTVADYDEAIEALQNARRDLSNNDHMGCSVCGDSGHSFSTCHHNPLLLARQWAEATGVWQCYHCGFIAANDEEARDHFGESPHDPPKCWFKARTALSTATGRETP